MKNEKPTRGRPRIREEGKEAIIYIRTTKEVKNAFNAQARAESKTLVGWILDTCAARLRKQPTPKGAK